MADRRIKILSGEREVWMEATEEEYQLYYRPWWQQKKREQRNRETMEENGYREESYEEWRENLADALDSLAQEERELVEKVFGEIVSTPLLLEKSIYSGFHKKVWICFGL